MKKEIEQIQEEFIEELRERIQRKRKGLISIDGNRKEFDGEKEGLRLGSIAKGFNRAIDEVLNELKIFEYKLMKKEKENWEKEFDENFDMYNSIHDDGTKIPVWSGSDFENIKSFIRQLLIQEKEKLIHDHKILVNTILETNEKICMEN